MRFVRDFSWTRVCVLVLLCVATPRPAAAEAPVAAAAEKAAVAPATVPPAKPHPPAAPRYEFQTGVACPFCAITPQFPTGQSGLHWHDHWRRVGTPEYVSILALSGAVLGTQLFWPEPAQARWEKPILFDSAVRNALRIDTAGGRSTAAVVSDVIVTLEVVQSAVIDPLLVAWWQRKSPFVAWQMVTIDAQAYALTLLLSEMTKRLTARARPWAIAEDCRQNPTQGECDSGSAYQSFFSGHAATSATGAGLICAHHTQLSLYQNDALDVGTCALAVAGTALTGALRIASDNHWTTDVLVGHLVGYTSGYLLPTLLYYRQFRSRPEPDHNAPSFAALPLVTGNGGLGLSLLGQF